MRNYTAAGGVDANGKKFKGWSREAIKDMSVECIKVKEVKLDERAKFRAAYREINHRRNIREGGSPVNHQVVNTEPVLTREEKLKLWGLVDFQLVV